MPHIIIESIYTTTKTRRVSVTEVGVAAWAWITHT